jgi:single-strand DNA-binding protein
MTDHISISGVIATQPRSIVTSEGLAICSFRVASPQRHFSKAENQWVEGETNWFTVSAFRQLAEHATTSLHKGERVVVRGRLKLRQWEREEKTGLSAEIEADALGHDLRWGSSSFTRHDGSEDAKPEHEEMLSEEPEKVPF